jgi:hypothetical protein
MNQYNIINIPAVLIFVVCIIFLQTGFTYYLSFQTVALYMVLLISVGNVQGFKNIDFILIILLFFSGLLFLKATLAPEVISENSENIIFTCVGIVIYAGIILSLPNLIFKNREWVLNFFYLTATLIIFMISGLVFVVELEIFSFLTRKALILQNVDLITNYASLESLNKSFAYLELNGLLPEIDLFYGEKSFLAAVTFASATCLIVTKKISNKYKFEFNKESIHNLSIFFSISILIYIKSFSGIFYSVIIFISFFNMNVLKKYFKYFPIYMAFLLFIISESKDYYVYRIGTISQSISFEQRFSGILDFGLYDYLFGITDPSTVNLVNFLNNGVSYIVAIAGFGGLWLLIYIFYRVQKLSLAINLHALPILCMLGIFIQNGAIFSPNKIVLLALFLIPLACINSLPSKASFDAKL